MRGGFIAYEQSEGISGWKREENPIKGMGFLLNLLDRLLKVGQLDHTLRAGDEVFDQIQIEHISSVGDLAGFLLKLGQASQR